MCHSIAVLETRSIPSPGQVPRCRTTAPCRRGGTIGTGPEQGGGGLVAGRRASLGLGTALFWSRHEVQEIGTGVCC